MNDEARLKEKLRAIEALFAGATTPGERDAADRARDRIRARMAEAQRNAPPVEVRFTVDPWSARLFIALSRRYGLEPYRYRGQRSTTVMLRAPEIFLRETFMPEFREMLRTLHAHLAEVTDRVIAEVLHGDTAEPKSLEPKQLPMPLDEE